MVNSPTFTDQTHTVDDQVQVFPSVAAAVADYSLFSSPKTPSCISQVYGGPLKDRSTKALQPGQTLVSASAAVKPFPRIGDHSGDVQITFVVGQLGVNVKVLLDLVVVIKGRPETILTISQPEILALTELGAQLASVAANRMIS